jgi:hypothetical protein
MKKKLKVNLEKLSKIIIFLKFIYKKETYLVLIINLINAKLLFLQ